MAEKRVTHAPVSIHAFRQPHKLQAGHFFIQATETHVAIEQRAALFQQMLLFQSVAQVSQQFLAL
jgi:hypothetical protein